MINHAAYIIFSVAYIYAWGLIIAWLLNIVFEATALFREWRSRRHEESWYWRSAVETMLFRSLRGILMSWFLVIIQAGILLASGLCFICDCIRLIYAHIRK